MITLEPIVNGLSLPKLLAAGCIIVSVVSCLFAESRDIFVRERPDVEAPVVAVVLPEEAFQVLDVEKGWVQVRQGDVKGWLGLDKLWGVVERNVPPVPSQPAANLPRFDFHCCRGSFETDRYQGLVDFLVGNHELSRKMSHPYYRDRVVRISSQWGPLYYFRTRQYYIKGIYLARFFDDRVRISVAKRRLFYQQIFGPMWSENFMEGVLKSNRGRLRSRGIFGKGREYLLGLNYHF